MRASITLVRKTGKLRTIMVPRAAVSVTGGIQPEVLAAALGNEHFHNGLAVRLLLSCPPRAPPRWSDAGIPLEVEERLNGLFKRLVELTPDQYEDGEPKPIRLKLSSEARAVFIDLFNRTGEDQCNV